MAVGGWQIPCGHGHVLGSVAKAVRAKPNTNPNPNPKTEGAKPRPWGCGQTRRGVAKAVGSGQGRGGVAKDVERGQGLGDVAKTVRANPNPNPKALWA